MHEDCADWTSTYARMHSEEYVEQRTDAVTGQLMRLAAWLKKEGFTQPGPVRLADERIGGVLLFG